MNKRGPKGGRMAFEVLGEKNYLKPDPNQSKHYREVWDSFVRDFPADYFRESDRNTLHNYCLLAEQMHIADARLRKEGPVLTGRWGPKENPLVGTVVKLTGVMLRHAKSLRAVPSARITSGLGVPKPPVGEDAADSSVEGLHLAS